MDDFNGKRELKYIKEFFMFGILTLVAWSLFSTVEISKSVAVLSVEFKIMRESIGEIKSRLHNITENKYMKSDAMIEFRRLTDFIVERTKERYTNIDAKRDSSRLELLIKNHNH